MRFKDKRPHEAEIDIAPVGGALLNCAAHDRKARATPLGRANLEAMSEQVCRVLHDEEPESKPVGVTLVASLESPENHRQGIGGDADAAVMHGDPHFRSKTARADPYGAAGRRVINGIPYQNLPDAAEQNR